MKTGSGICWLVLVMSLHLLFFYPLGRAQESVVSQHLHSMEKNLDLIQFKASEVLYQQIRESVVSRFFPIDQFPIGLARLCKQVEQDASRLSLRSLNMRSDWYKQKDSTQLFKGLKEGCNMYARLEIEEWKESVKGILEYRQTLIQSKTELEEFLIKGYTPRSIGERLIEDLGWYLEASVYSFVCLLLPLGGWLRRGRRTLIWTGLACLLFFYPIHITLGRIKSHWGPPEPVVGVRASVQSLKSYWHAFDHAVLSINDSVTWLDQYCQSMDLFNETVIQGIVQFTRKVTDLSQQGVANSDPLAALEVVTQSRDRIAEQKIVLTKLAAIKSKRNQATDLDQLLRFLQYFEVFFTQLETSIYVNLKAGYEMNQFFVENMDIMLQHIRDGNLVSCLTILTELHRQQLGQLGKLKESNTFVRHTNDAIAQIRQESTRLQPSLESEEMEAWIKKMAGKGSMALAALPSMALLAPVAITAPVSLVGGAIALTGYYWSGYYEKVESEARGIITELSKLDNVLIKVENSLSNHEKVLIMLMEEIGSVLRNINHTESRFNYIQVRRSFSPREVEILTVGVNRLKDSVKLLTARYQESMNSLFSRIISSASSSLNNNTPRQLPSEPVPILPPQVQQPVENPPQIPDQDL